MDSKQITLSPEKLREIKEDVADETRFRTKVLIQLESLKDIPTKVTKLGVHSVIHWCLIIVLLGLVMKVMAR